jgi:dienelactone hydrolase
VVVPTKAYSGAVVLITDIFGYKGDGIRRWADRLADAVSNRLP